MVSALASRIRWVRVSPWTFSSESNYYFFFHFFVFPFYFSQFRSKTMCEYILKVRQYWICNGKEAKLVYFSKWLIADIRAKQDTLRGYQANYSRYNALIEMIWPCTWWQILYKRKKECFVVLATFCKNDNSSCFWYTKSFNWKSNFVLMYYKSEDGYPSFLFSYLLLIALYTNSTYIIWLKKYSVVFYFLNF